MNRFNSNRAFSLIEVMLVVAITSIIALAIATLIANQINANTFVTDQLSKAEVNRTVATLMGFGESCNKTLVGVHLGSVGTPTPIASIKDNTGAVVYTSLTPVEGLQLGQIEVLNESVGAAGTSGFVQIIVPINRRPVGGPSALKSVSVKTLVAVDGSLNITSCGASGPTGGSPVSNFQIFASGHQTSTSKILDGWDLCVFSGYKTTEDDKNNYDGCFLLKTANPRQWELRLSKAAEDSLTCYANCMNF
jgi:prepilin-type N-terminal cleavage/methylation domain-containing protein